MSKVGPPEWHPENGYSMPSSEMHIDPTVVKSFERSARKHALFGIARSAIAATYNALVIYGSSMWSTTNYERPD